MSSFILTPLNGRIDFRKDSGVISRWLVDKSLHRVVLLLDELQPTLGIIFFRCYLTNIWGEKCCIHIEIFMVGIRARLAVSTVSAVNRPHFRLRSAYFNYWIMKENKESKISYRKLLIILGFDWMRNIQ